MHDLILQILSYIRGIWRYRWVALALAWAVAIPGWIVVAKIPDRYTASARMVVDTNSMLAPLLRGLTVQPDHLQQVAMMSQMLLNKDNLEKIVRMTDLDLGIKDERERQKLLDMLKKNIQLSSSRRDPSFYSVSFEHGDPVVARNVTQAVVDIFIEEAQASDQQKGTAARSFLDRQIEQYEARLKEAELRLADFKRRNAGLMSGDVASYYTALAAQKTQLEDARLALREAKWRREELGYQLEAANQSLEIAAAPSAQDEETAPPTSTDPRIAALETRLDTLLLTYTEKHPTVIELQRLLEELRKRARAAEQRAAQRATPPPGGRAGLSAAALNLSATTVHGNLQMAYNEAEAQVAALEARVAEYEKRVKELEDKIDSIPTIEAELKQLDRDYSTISAQYRALLQRREEARLARQVEQTTDAVRFRVIDAPTVPSKPSAPNRLLLDLGVLAGAIAVGLGAAFLLDMLRPVFDDRRVLYKATGLPVLGTVALVRSYAQRRRELLRLLPFFALTLGLFAMLGFVVVVPVQNYL